MSVFVDLSQLGKENGVRQFLKQVKADFDKRTEGFTYKSPIPAMIKEPSGLPDKMRSHGTIFDLKQSIINSTGDHGLGPHSHEHFHDH
jgi:hypothetical protein